MGYILPTGALTSIDFLREDYAEERKVDFSKTPSMFGLPIVLGGTDIVSRNVQTNFIKKLKAVLSVNLKKEEEIKTPEEWQANLTASRIIIAACLYVKSQISRPKSNSALYNLINKHLGITKSNFLDEADKKICFQAANRVIHHNGLVLDEANAALRKMGLTNFSEDDWQGFSDYITSQIKKDVKVNNPYLNYPITSITQPAFGAAFSYTGATIGFLGGDMISQSTQFMSPKFQITALIGSTLLVLGPAGPMGVALFSQVIAGKLITAFCSISLAHLLGTVMGLIGQGVGLGIGLPLDLAYRLLWKACALIGGYYTTYENTSTGIRIVDGVTMIAGVELRVVTEEELEAQLAKGYTKKVVEIEDNGTLSINGQKVTTTEVTEEVQLPPEVIAQLKSTLEMREAEKLEKVVAPQPTEESGFSLSGSM